MEDVEKGEHDIHMYDINSLKPMFGLPRVANFGHNTKFTIKLLSSGRFANAFFGIRILTFVMVCLQHLESGTDAA